MAAAIFSANRSIGLDVRQSVRASASRSRVEIHFRSIVAAGKEIVIAGHIWFDPTPDTVSKAINIRVGLRHIRSRHIVSGGWGITGNPAARDVGLQVSYAGS